MIRKPGEGKENWYRCRSWWIWIKTIHCKLPNL